MAAVPVIARHNYLSALFAFTERPSFTFRTVMFYFKKKLFSRRSLIDVRRIDRYYERQKCYVTYKDYTRQVSGI